MSGATAARCLIGVFLATSTLCVACKDHAYRHDVEGQVVDAKGTPIPGAIVTRVSDKGEPYGIPDLYQQKTDEKGHFRFESEGRGPAPAFAAPWRLAVEIPNRKDHAHFEVSAVWSGDRAKCYGYCAKELSLVVK